MTPHRSLLFGLGVCLALGAGAALTGESPRAEDRQKTQPTADNAQHPTGGSGPLAAVAGSYYFGDGLGVNCSLSLTASGRFTFAWHGCLGLYDQNKGEAAIQKRHLVLKPEQPNVQQGFKGTPTDFIPVRWGQRLYLVPKDQGEEFCNLVNQGQEPRQRIHGQVYLRQDDWTKPVTGLPDVPREWESKLLKKPLHAKVVEVLNDGRARLDFGTAEGAWQGMQLWMDINDFGLVEVVEAQKNSCVVATKYPDVAKIAFKKGMGVRSKLGGGD